MWLRHDLATMKQRLKALDTQAAPDGRVLTEAQLAALERAQGDKEAHGEFESECPGDCGAQDTFYVGTLKGVGRIYQQTFIDTYTRSAFAKRYAEKTPVTAADLLNDRVLRFFAAHEILLSRVLTDRGTDTAARSNGIRMNAIWRSKTSTIRGPRRNGRRRMASASASTRRCATSSTAWRFGNSSTRPEKACSVTSIAFSTSTTRSGLIRDGGAMGRLRCRRS